MASQKQIGLGPGSSTVQCKYILEDNIELYMCKFNDPQNHEETQNHHDLNKLDRELPQVPTYKIWTHQARGFRRDDV